MTKVAVWGPNLPRSAHGETFHVHADGCADIARNIGRGIYVPDSDMGGEVIDVDNTSQITTYVYPPGDFDYDPDGPEFAIYDEDIYIFPCVRL